MLSKTAAPQAKASRRKILAACLLPGVLVAIVLSLALSRSTAEERPPETPQVARTPQGEPGRIVKATGVVKPCVGAEVRVGSRVSGVVQRLYVKVGDTVSKGQVLAELDSRDLEARRDEALAGLHRAQAEFRYSQTEFRRKRELQTAAVIAPSEMDLAERACAVAEQQVSVAKASLTYAETQLDYAHIAAPISGVVASVSTQEGETVSASFSSPTFVTLIDLSRLEVWAYVDETDIGRIEPGQSARFTVDTYGEENFEGRVSTIYPKAEIRDNVVDYVTVVNFEARAGRILRPEMTAVVRISLEATQCAQTLQPNHVRCDIASARSKTAAPQKVISQGEPNT